MDNKIFSIDEMIKMAQPTIKIPNFDNTGTINVKVQKPKLLNMTAKGQIPNHLLAIASSMINGTKVEGVDSMDDETKIKTMSDTMDLYCMACLVEPTYEEFKEIMTDDQKGTIFSWAIGQVSDLDSFRTEQADDTHSEHGEDVSKKTK